VSEITVATYPNATQLTTLATVKAELGIDSTADDTLMTTLIDQVSGVIEDLCHRPFYRAQYTEELKGTKPVSTRLVLGRLPVVQLDEISYYGDAQTLSDFAIQNSNAGFIYHSYGFARTTHTNDWSIKYKAGYLLPGDDVSASTISVDASASTYTDSAAGFPPALAPGDSFVVGGLDSTNNGRKTVVTASTSVIEVSETLSDQTAGATASIVFCNLPEVVERAAIDMVKVSYQTRKTDPTLGSLTVGPVSAKYQTGGSEDSGQSKYTLPPGLGKYRVHMRG
jgi:hypothetical protein